MAASVEQLHTILELEQKKGCANLAVIGGLDKYLRRWAAQIKESINEPHLTRFGELQLSRSDYAAWDREKRQQWVREVLNLLAEIEKTRENKKATSPSSQSVPVASKPRSAPKGYPSSDGGSLDSPLTVIREVTPTLASKLGKLGVRRIRDLLYFFPRRHLDYSQRKRISELVEGEEQTILATVWQAREISLGGRKSTEAIVGDETGNIRVVWFNQPYLARKLATNAQIVISGRVSTFKGQRVFESPEWEPIEDKELIHTGRLVPLYPLTQGLHPRPVRRLLKKVTDNWAERLVDFLPPELRSRCGLLELPEAIRQAHFPDNELLKNRARQRLAFDELFLLQLGVLTKKREWQEDQQGSPIHVRPEIMKAFLDSLPFTLTTAQQRVLEEVVADLGRETPMSRLLQGEVGSGKTVIAIAALAVAAASGYQGAFMAPTEILAEQHFKNVCQLFSSAAEQVEGLDHTGSYRGLLPHPFTIALLTGSLSEREKEEIQRRIREGEADIVIGTHALIQKGVEFQRLGLAVVDEQHRFGVLQRLALRQKGFNPHILVMTATPIPRTLALTLYGDLDLSTIDELPPGRQVVKTRCLEPTQRETAYTFLRRQIAEGRQAFIICPLIEESESIEARAAVAEYERLSQEVFPDLRLGLLHGRMPAAEKEAVMQLFRDGKLNILVSTPVVEVGIDVPNATVMLVEGADRFGLSQLHQFRGRVGRGSEQSYCLLLAERPSVEGRARLKLVEQIRDGFALAEEDLKLRGPGEFFGTQQSGLPDLRMARLSDTRLLEIAREEAIGLFGGDPTLQAPEHRLLAKELAQMWQHGGDWS